MGGSEEADTEKEGPMKESREERETGVCVCGGGGGSEEADSGAMDCRRSKRRS